MTDLALLDNDIVLKACAYRCHEVLLQAATMADGPPSMLTVAGYAIRSRLERSRAFVDRGAAITAFDQLLCHLTLIDPNEDEVAVAADLEALASERGLQLDVGESQLLAILLGRGLSLLFTGDKRAIEAIGCLAPDEVGPRIVCLERFMACVLETIPCADLRIHVCSEPQVDKAMTICFACGSEHTEPENVAAGLESYAGSLARTSAGVMAPAEILQRNLRRNTA